MKETLQQEQPLTRLKRNIVTMFHNNTSILDDVALINIKRIFYLSLLVIPSRVLHIFLFSGDTSAPEVWKQGIILSHLVVLTIWVVILMIVYRLKNRPEANTTMHVLQYFVPSVTMISGVIIVTLDQLVTTNITPFLLVSIVTGAIFVIRPLVSTIIFFTSYVAYYNLIALTITCEQVLLSNRVNGTTAICIGLIISILIWHYNYTNIVQGRQLALQKQQLKQMAYYDQLTNLYNRHFFNKMIAKEFASVERYGHDSAIIILDVDDFKKINDTYGHLAGDRVLKQLGQMLVDNVRKSDTVARFGGEEFIILAPNTSIAAGFTLAEKLRKLIAKTDFAYENETLHITASIGVSLLKSTDNYGLENYFSLADNALYRAKKRGKNRVETIT